MKRIVTNVFVCVMLSGCTFNQYGPSVVIKEKDLNLSQSINLEQVKEVGEGSATAAPIITGNTRTQSNTQTTVKRARTVDCVPMPELKDPPKISLDDLKKNMGSEAALSEIFKNNHAQLYDGWKSMKKELEQWKKNPNRC